MVAGQFVLAFPDIMVDPGVNDAAADFVRDKIDEIVKNPRDRERPEALRISARQQARLRRYRLLCDVQSRQNVALIDIRKSPIKQIAANGVQTARCVLSARRARLRDRL
ncbi:MAG: hypothetical protein WDM89_07160 [Rhizomicrobium sp.]